MNFFDKIKSALGFKKSSKDDNDLYKKELKKGSKEVKTEGRLRRFGGKIKNFKDNSERQFEKKHLKAYLAGHAYFRYGFRDETSSTGTIRVPAWHKVKEIWAKPKK